jgi:hypothetical protein
MVGTGCMHTQKIRILREDNAPLSEGQRQMIFVGSGMKSSFRRSKHVHSTPAQSSHHGFSDMLVRVELDSFSH